jgi:hypothetical protein
MKLQAVVLSLLLAPAAGWGMTGTGQSPAPAGGQPGVVGEARLGVVDSIESSQVESDSESAAGPVIGGVLAGVPAARAPSVCVVDDSVGAGLPSDRRRSGFKPVAATERKAAYFIRVRLEDGSRQTVTQIGLGGLRLGDSVRIERYRLSRCEPSQSEAVSAPDGGGRLR